MPPYTSTIASYPLTGTIVVPRDPYMHYEIRQRIWVPPSYMHSSVYQETETDRRSNALVEAVNEAALGLTSMAEVTDVLESGRIPVYKTDNRLEIGIVAARLLGLYVQEHSKLSFQSVSGPALPIAGTYLADINGEIICAAINFDIMKTWWSNAIIHPLTHDLNPRGMVHLRAFLAQFIEEIGVRSVQRDGATQEIEVRNRLKIKKRPGVSDWMMNAFFQSTLDPKKAKDAANAYLVISVLSKMTPQIERPTRFLLKEVVHPAEVGEIKELLAQKPFNDDFEVKEFRNRRVNKQDDQVGITILARERQVGSTMDHS